ncbi:MAG: sigma factor-like helix-turn-helix DNA-binding protein, partial [Planctomycetota bacterium]
RLSQALQALSEIARICLLLRVVGGNSYEDIGHALDMPPATAMSHVHRSRQRLAKVLGSRASAAELEPEPPPPPTSSRPPAHDSPRGRP